MTQLQDITDIVDLEIKSLEQVANEGRKPYKYKKWFEIQERLRQEKKAPSLSAYLLYEYQFMGKDTVQLSKELGIPRGTVNNLLVRIGIPMRNKSENSKGKNMIPDDELKQLADLVREEIRLYQEGTIGRLSENLEISELIGGVSPTSLIKYLRNHLSEEELNLRSNIIKHQHLGLSPRDQKALLDLVREEILLFKQGKISKISTQDELADSVGVYSGTLFRYLEKSLTEEERDYRNSAIFNKIRPEDREALIKLVKEELNCYRSGKPISLTNNSEFGDMLGVGRNVILYCLRQLPSEDKKLRRRVIRENTGRNAGLKTAIERKATRGRKAGIVIQIVKEEIRLHREGKLERFSKTSEIAELTGYSESMVAKYLSVIPDEDRLYRESSLQSTTMTERNETYGLPEFVPTPERIAKLSAATKKRNRIHGNPGKNLTLEERRANYKKGLGKIGYEERVRIAGKTLQTMARRYTPEEIFKMRGRGGKKAGKKAVELLRKKYFVEGRFYSQSQQEGAVALLLEKYVPGYQVRDGLNFQVRDKGIDNGGIDFLVDREFLEWHPIVLGTEKTKSRSRRGDIPNSDAGSYFRILEQLDPAERRSLKSDYARSLALNYMLKRQQAVDNSEYVGLKIHLATNERELYDFISRYSDGLPEYDYFKREFKSKIKYVKNFQVDSSKQDLAEIA